MRAVDDPPDVVKALIGTAAIDGGGGVSDAVDHTGAVGVPEQKQTVGARSRVAELETPAGGEHGLPDQVVLMSVGCAQIGGEREDGGAGGGIDGDVELRKRGEQVGSEQLELYDLGRVEAELVIGRGQDLAVVETIGGAQNSCSRAGQPPGETEARGDVVTVAAIGDTCETVDLVRGGSEGVTQPERDAEIRAQARRAAGVEGPFGLAESAMHVADGAGKTRGNAEQEISDGVAAEIVPEIQIAAMRGDFATVDLRAGEVDSGVPR